MVVVDIKKARKKYRRNGGHHRTPSMWGSGAEGIRLVKIAAFPFIRSKDSLEVALLTHSLSSRPVCLAKACAILFTCTSAVLCHPPRDSNARGMKATPCLWQSSAAPLIFLSKAKSRLWPGVVAASMVACCSGLMTVREHLLKKRMFSFGHCPNYLSPPSPHFGRQNQRFARMTEKIPIIIMTVQW